MRSTLRWLKNWPQIVVEDPGTHAEWKEVQQIAYEIDRVEDLREALKFLREKGITIVSGLRRRGPGNDTTVDFLDPDGNNIQLYCEMDQIGWNDVSRPKEMWARGKLE